MTPRLGGGGGGIGESELIEFYSRNLKEMFAKCENREGVLKDKEGKGLNILSWLER